MTDLDPATAAKADAAIARINAELRAPAELEQARQLLAEAAAALWEISKAALTVKPSLDQPYPDAPELTPWTRWMERRAREAHDTAMKIRKHLKAAATREEPR